MPQPPLRVKRVLKILHNAAPLRTTIKRLIVSAMFYGFCLYLMSLMAVVSGMRFPRGQQTLPDLGFDIIPPIDGEQSTIPNMMITISLLSMAIRCLFHEKGITIIRRFMIVHGICALLRCFVIATTSYPDPSGLCADYQSPATTTGFWKESLVKNGLLTCGDLMFSGHTLVYVLTAMTWTKYFTRYETMIVWIIEIGSALTLIGTRMHYTDDVLISLYVAITVFHIYHVWALEPSYRKRIPILEWLEEEREDTFLVRIEEINQEINQETVNLVVAAV